MFCRMHVLSILILHLQLIFVVPGSASSSNPTATAILSFGDAPWNVGQLAIAAASHDGDVAGHSPVIVGTIVPATAAAEHVPAADGAAAEHMPAAEQFVDVVPCGTLSTDGECESTLAPSDPETEHPSAGHSDNESVAKAAPAAATAAATAAPDEPATPAAAACTNSQGSFDRMQRRWLQAAAAERRRMAAASAADAASAASDAAQVSAAAAAASATAAANVAMVAEFDASAAACAVGYDNSSSEHSGQFRRIGKCVFAIISC